MEEFEMKKMSFEDKQKMMLADMVKRMISIVELYRKDDDADVLKIALCFLQMDLSTSHHYMDEVTFRKMHRFTSDFLEKLYDLKLFSQFSTESIVLHSDGPKVCDEKEVEAFANSFYFSKSEEVEGIEIFYPEELREYQDAFKQAVKEYYTCYLGEKPDIYDMIVDGKAYGIVASKAYKLIEELYKDSLNRLDV